MNWSHGSSGYSNFGCRCDDCREAWSEYQRARLLGVCANGCGRPAWRITGRRGYCRTCAGEAQLTAEHGTESRYKRGCRCGPCTGAATAARRARRHADMEATREYERTRRRHLRVVE